MHHAVHGSAPKEVFVHSPKSSLPRLSDLFNDLHPVIAVFLEGLDSPYGYWYPVDKHGEVDEARAKAMYLAYQKELGGDELTGLMPLMRYQPVRGVEKFMLLDTFDEAVHPTFDMKNEEDFRNKRRAMGPTHPGIRTFGSNTIFGGLESRFDHQAVVRSPLFGGRGCKAYSSAKIIGPTLLGSNVTLNTGSAVTRSVVGNGSQVDRVEVKDCLIGSKVFIKRGAVLDHRLGLNGEPITVTDERRRNGHGEIELERPKMGCVIGDGCRIGSNATLGPGTILLPGVRVPNGLIVPSGIYDQSAIDKLPRAL